MGKDIAFNNGRFKIMTDTGFSDFVGVLQTKKESEMVVLSFDNDENISTTPDHVYRDIDLNQIKASDINVDTVLYGGIKVTNIDSDSRDTVYDILHVEGNHRHYVTAGGYNVLVDNCLYLDELGFVAGAEEFYESVYPTISSSKTSKVIITSTPKGLNFFYKMWVEAETCRNEYVAYDVKWFEHPDRDQAWYDSQVANMNAKSVEQELNCVGASTVININDTLQTIGSLYKKLQTNKNSNIAYINSVDIGIDNGKS